VKYDEFVRATRLAADFLRTLDPDLRVILLSSMRAIFCENCGADLGRVVCGCTSGCEG
jgi:hypothetical protein